MERIIPFGSSFFGASWFEITDFGHRWMFFLTIDVGLKIIFT
jgi:uncharacterized glyoxalase superfamily protein PhnB